MGKRVCKRWCEYQIAGDEGAEILNHFCPVSDTSGDNDNHAEPKTQSCDARSSLNMQFRLS